MNPILDTVAAVGGGWTPFVTGVVLKSAVVLLVAYLVTLVLRDASASLRHHVWTLAFGIVLVLPLLSGTLPAWHVSVPGWEAPAGTATVPESGEVLSGAEAEDASRERSRTGSAGAPESVAGTEGAAALEAGGAPEAPATASGEQGSMDGLIEWVRTARTPLAVLWLLGVGLLLAHVALGIASAWWTSRTASPVEESGWRDLVADVKEELGVGVDLRIRRSSRVGTPMTWGFLRPVLLLPDEALGWSTERRRAVALHELAHVRRRDCLVHLLAQVARAIHWVNPLAWVGASHIRRERERACDDLVLKAGTPGPDYAELLLDVARSQHARRAAWGAVSMARPSQLEGRLLAILDPSRDRRGVGRAVSTAAFVVAAATAVPLAAFQAEPVPAGGAAADRVVRESRVVRGGSAEGTTPSGVAERPGATARNDSRGVASADGTIEIDGLELELSGLSERLAAAESDTMEQRIVAAVAQALQSDRADLRSRAAHTLGSTESPLAVAPLSRVLQDESAEVREQAVWALGMIESPDAVEGLVRVLAADPSADVRKEAAWALGMIEDPTAVTALSTALEDEDTGVREQAVWALGMIESPEAVQPLLGVLRDARVQIREQAAWALGMIESPDAVDALVRLLREDESAGVREQAAWALGMIEDPAAAGALIDALEDESEDVAEQAMWALGQVSG